MQIYTKADADGVQHQSDDTSNEQCTKVIRRNTLRNKANLPNFFQALRSTKLTTNQQEYIFREYWEKGFTSLASIRTQMFVRSEQNVTFEQIRRTIAACRLKAKDCAKTVRKRHENIDVTLSYIY